MKSLDDMIHSLFGAVQRGIGYVAKHPRHSEVVEWIDENVPVNVDDSADHFLLRQFDLAHRASFVVPTQDVNCPRGEMTLSRPWFEIDAENGGFTGPARRDAYRGDHLWGVIPWRSLHKDPDWPCTECGYHENLHRDDAGGGPVTDATAFIYCTADDGKCNCGQNIGR